jgi:tRNA(adenine34) deaminase
MNPGSASHDSWIQKALIVAERSLPQDVPVGAIVVDASHTVIGEGWNTREQASDPTGHAEMMALKNAAKHQGDWRLTDCTLYVTLEPCPMCASAILQARVSTVVYGATDPIQGALGSALNLATLYTTPVTVRGGIGEADCKTQLQDFFKARR